jgi:glycosyltransferase involved in cell wall biosynthesis
MPAYNERGSVRRMAEAILARGTDRLIVVDDGSSDGTAGELAGLDLDLLIHPRNLGKGVALATGMRRALALGYGRVITIDADGQHSAADIPRLAAQSQEDPDAVVIAARTRQRAAAPALRRFANRVADFWISWACGRPITDTQSGFRLYPGALLRSIPLTPRPGQGFVFETALLVDAVHAGARVRTVAIDTRYEPTGRASHYRPWHDTWSIVVLVGGRLLCRGLYPLGLLRSLALLPPTRAEPGAAAGDRGARCLVPRGPGGLRGASDTPDGLP